MQGHPELSMAHVTVPDIRWVDWHALKAAGFKGCVFDKDNTLTEPYALGIHEPLTGSMQQCMDAFDGHVALLSNSAGLQEFDPKGKHVTCWPALMAPNISLHAHFSLPSADTCKSILAQQSPYLLSQTDLAGHARLYRPKEMIWLPALQLHQAAVHC